MPRPKKPRLMDIVLEQLARRRAAILAGGAGLVPVCCRECGRAIATTFVDRAKGEPDILLDFPENIGDNWICTECAVPFGAVPRAI